MKHQKLADLIRDHIPLKPVKSGWETCKCNVCNDYKNRGGFKFDGDSVAYSCFNCGVRHSYKDGSGEISKSFRTTLQAFGISDAEITKAVGAAFFFKPPEDKVIKLSNLQQINTSTPEIELPKGAIKLGHPQFIEYQEKLAAYLIDRKIDISKHIFYFSLEPRFLNRIIIPFYRSGKLIYWQARSIISTEKKRYDNPPISRDAVMFNMDELHNRSNAPLFITEGVFDAMVINGISILGSRLNRAKIKILSESPRRKIFVIDRDKAGANLAEDALNNKWEITFAPDGTKDVNQAAQRFGLCWTAYQLAKNIRQDTSEARTFIKLACV